MTQSEPPVGSGAFRPAPGYPPPAHLPPPPPGYAPPGYPPPGYPMPGYPIPGYPPGRSMLPPGVAPNGQPLANFGDRFLAYLIDYAILCGALLVVAVPTLIIAVTSSVHRLTINADGSLNGASMLSFYLVIFAVDIALLLLGLVATYVYQVEMMYRSGQTVGKRVMKLQVVCLDPGAPMTRGVAAKRSLIGSLVGSIVGIFSLVDGLWQLWDQPFRQCLHDKVAGTVVVKRAR